MSQLEVDKIIPQSGTTLTIGDSGDTISFADGATLAIDTNTLAIDSTNNRVGIGTTSPDTLLHISKSGGAILRLENPDGIVSDNEIIGKIEFEHQDNGGAGVSAFINAFANGINGAGNISFGTGAPGGNASEVMRITSQGLLGIGTSSPSATLDVVSSGTNSQDLLELSSASGVRAKISTDAQDDAYMYLYDSSDALKVVFRTDGNDSYINGGGNVGIGTSSPTGSGQVLHLNSSTTVTDFHMTNSTTGSASTDGLVIRQSGLNSEILNRENGNTILYNNGAESMRIENDGDLLIGKTANSFTTEGHILNNGGNAFHTKSGDYPLGINRISNDGDLIALFQANTQEGSISVSGSTVSYNGFTGTHWSRLVDNSKPTILKGTILESLDEMMDWYQVQFDITDDKENIRTEKQSYALGDGESVGDVITYNFEGTDYQATIIQEGDVKHTKSKISDTVDAKNVYGVFMAWDNDDDTVNDMYVAQTGTFVVRMNSAETVSKGDLIQSNGDGTGKVQADDIIRSSTVAKILSTTKIETYEDGSYIVPCSLHC